ncbi:MAG: ArsR/SmtB family transcription factor [Desulfomonilaceae bacterium]
MAKKGLKQSNSSDTPLPDLLDAEAFALVCKALGHPARIKIMEYLRETDKCFCGKIVQILPLAQSTVSQHLKCLKEAGLIWGELEGPNTCYCLNREVIKKFKRTVESL